MRNNLGDSSAETFQESGRVTWKREGNWIRAIRCAVSIMLPARRIFDWTLRNAHRNATRACLRTYICIPMLNAFK